MNESKTKNSYQNIFLGLFLAIGLIVSAYIIGSSIKAIKSYNKIEVKGYAEKEIISDLGIWQGDCSSTFSTDLITAYKKLQDNVNRTINFLINKGVSRKEIQTSSVTTNKHFKINEKGFTTNIIEGYTLTQRIIVTSQNVELIKILGNEATEIIQEGVELYSDPPQFFYTKLDTLKIEMLGDAAKDAKKRAEKLAESTNSKVIGISSARQGIFQITDPYTTDVSDYGYNDTYSIRKVIKAVVTIEFLIE